MICRECGRSKAKRLRKFFAKRLAATGVRTVRPLLTSCQDLCPGKGTAVSVALSGRVARTYVVRTETEADALVRSVADASRD